MEEPRPDITFHEFASAWFEAHKGEWREATRLDYEWQLSNHLLPYFAGYRLSAMTVADVDRYRQSKVREAKLSTTSINKTITRLGQVLELAEEYGYVDRNVARGRRRRLRATTPPRTYLDRAEQVEALLDAAGELDANAREDYKGLGRRALLTTLALGGLRIGEALALRWRDLDLAGGRLRVGEAKTDAGVREVELLPVLRDELAEHKALVAHSRLEDLVFPTTEGCRQTATNVRKRVLGKAVEKADERLDEAGKAPLPERLTPHSLRRTYASLLFALGRTAPEVMDQLGHSDPKLTLRIYARAMRREEGESARLRVLAGDPEWAPTGTSGPEEPPSGAIEPPGGQEKPRLSGVLSRWARLVSNQRPLACEASALPLSYAPSGCMVEGDSASDELASEGAGLAPLSLTANSAVQSVVPTSARSCPRSSSPRRITCV